MPDSYRTLPASIDIGSHSTILLIADFETDESGKQILRPKIQKVEVCRLGEDIYNTGRISEERQKNFLKFFQDFVLQHTPWGQKFAPAQ